VKESASHTARWLKPLLTAKRARRAVESPVRAV